MSQMSEKIARTSLLGVVGLGAAVAAGLMISRHHALAPMPDGPGPSVTLATLKQGFGGLRVAPAVSYANLSVYPVYTAGPAPAGPAKPEFTTLAQGMDRGGVTASEPDCHCYPGEGREASLPSGVSVPDSDVTNADEGQEHRGANLLMVTNTSPKPTYVPDGQVVPGGGQDRGAAADTIVPARSAQVGVPAFCVEHGRSSGPGPGFSKNVTLAIPSVRYAMQVTGEQQPVWDSVAAATRHYGAETPSGTYTALPGSRAAKQAALPYAEALTVPIQAATPGRVVGVVVRINGKIVCADLYRNPALFNQMWPALLQSYALQAAIVKGKAAPAPPMGEAGRRAADEWVDALNDAPGVQSRSATLTAVARVQNCQGAGTRTAAITGDGSDRKALLHEAFWTRDAVLTN